MSKYTKSLDWTLEHWWDDGATALTTYVGSESSLAITEQGASAPADAELLQLDRPVRLHPIHIPKPWGEEIWYTGVEARGQAMVSQRGEPIPLPWLLAACDELPQALVLLKILAPLPEPVFGDLYFELHEEKQEVYVITQIDPVAWPSGTGAIRMGFDAAKASDLGFRQRFIQAVNDYKQVRIEIDALIDEQRSRVGVGLNEPVAADVAKAWLATIPESLKALEEERRAHLDSFTQLLPLTIGDVVKVPTLCPHSLQHGVRAVEFQTPVYERLIVAFAQKVLTQAHWDTERAVELMQLETPAQPKHELIFEKNGARDERIVDFDDFSVRRFTLQPGASLTLATPAQYALCMVIAGCLNLNGVAIAAEDAVLLTKLWRAEPITNKTDENLIVLWAEPAPNPK